MSSKEKQFSEHSVMHGQNPQTHFPKAFRHSPAIMFSYLLIDLVLNEL